MSLSSHHTSACQFPMSKNSILYTFPYFYSLQKIITNNIQIGIKTFLKVGSPVSGNSSLPPQKVWIRSYFGMWASLLFQTEQNSLSQSANLTPTQPLGIHQVGNTVIEPES